MKTKLKEYKANFLKTEADALKIVKQNGDILQYIPDTLKTKKVCIEAVKQYGNALYFVPKHFYDICLKIFLQNINY